MTHECRIRRDRWSGRRQPVPSSDHCFHLVHSKSLTSAVLLDNTPAALLMLYCGYSRLSSGPCHARLPRRRAAPWCSPRRRRWLLFGSTTRSTCGSSTARLWAAAVCWTSCTRSLGTDGNRRGRGDRGELVERRVTAHVATPNDVGAALPRIPRSPPSVTEQSRSVTSTCGLVRL